MGYIIQYACTSHVGNLRKANQDNLICTGKFLDSHQSEFHLAGQTQSGLFGVFDGMGGEERGEMASYLAAKCAAETQLGQDPREDLANLCTRANEAICRFIEENDLFSCGTTAAMLAFTPSGLWLCNIGDSRIYRFRAGELEQLSIDHVAFAPHRAKPPLSQNLGIPAKEMVLEPFFIQPECRESDRYLICSDGLTDMVSEEEIAQILADNETAKSAAATLQQAALQAGGRDNITIVLCDVQKQRGWLYSLTHRK